MALFSLTSELNKFLKSSLCKLRAQRVANKTKHTFRAFLRELSFPSLRIPFGDNAFFSSGNWLG